MSAELTQQALKEFLHYNQETGHFTYNYRHKGVPKGTIAGTLNRGYLVISINNKTCSLHRLAFLWVEGELPAKSIDVDHINGNRADNRWINLRLCTRSQNNFNQKLSPNNKTKIKGLSLTKTGYYAAQVYCNGVRTSRSFTLNEKAEAIVWLETTRQSLHKGFANNGN